MLNRLLIILVAIALLALSPTLASAQSSTAPADDLVEILVRPGGQRTLIPLAVPDVRVSGGASNDELAGLGDLMRRCFRIAGYFEVLGPDRYFFDPSRDGLDPAQMNFQNWFNVGAQAVVRGRIELTAGGQAVVDYRLYDVTGRTQIDVGFGPRTVPVDRVRGETYAFINAVVLYFSGSPGIFGQRIAFGARGRGGTKQIFTIRTDGSDLSGVTSGDTIHLFPAWGPGGAVMYTSYANDNPDLWIGSGRSARTLSSQPGLNMGARLSPDGSEIAIALTLRGNADIFILSASGEILRQCTTSAAEDISPTWSPDGSRIAFVSDRAGGPQIFVMNRDCSGQRRVTFRGSYNTNPDWSPLGDAIAFTGRAGNRYDIFTVEPDSGRIERITQDQGSNTNPSWSPDGRYLVFASSRGGGGNRLYISTADGQSQTLITPNVSGVESPAWQR